MFNYKKQYDAIAKTKDLEDILAKLDIALQIKKHDLLVDYEALIKRPIKDSEFNLLCDFVFNFSTNLKSEVIITYLFKLLLLDKDLFDYANSTRSAKFKISDLKVPAKVNEMYSYIYDTIYEDSEDADDLLF